MDSLFYTNLFVTSDLDFETKLFMHISVMARLGNNHSIPLVIGSLPVFVNSLMIECMSVTRLLMNDSNYIVSVKAQIIHRITRLTRSKRLKTLCLVSVETQSMANSLCMTRNTKARTLTMIPNSVMSLELGWDPIFRLVLHGSLWCFDAKRCYSLVNVKRRESIIYVSQYMPNKRLKYSQKSIRHCVLTFPMVDSGFRIGKVRLGAIGIYNN